MYVYDTITSMLRVSTILKPIMPVLLENRSDNYFLKWVRCAREHTPDLNTTTDTYAYCN